MKEHPDINDTLRSEGPEAVRGRHDKAPKYNGNRHRSQSHDVRPPKFSDEALALRFAEQHASDLRHVAEWSRSRWLIWDGQRWCPDGTLLAFDLARGLCREASTECKKDKIARSITSANTVAAVERLAKADRRLAATADQWDTNPWLMNTGGSTFELRTGMGRRPEPGDYITKRTICAAASPGTPCPLWTKFLDRVTDGNAELQQFLQRYIGYCLTGATSEHAFVFAYGAGANGKSTFINTIVQIFGDYASIADTGTFLASNSERHPTDLAKLHGARLVVAQETQQGRRWDETKIKVLTGGDRITARFMKQDFFDFQPTFKLFIIGNHKPKLTTVDEAMRRRLLLVPFTVHIPEVERDADLPKKLEAEWPAILRWAMNGCLEWQRIGLAAPNIVRLATKEYFETEDILGQWLEEECDVEINNEYKWEPVADLFESWSTFATKGGDRPGSKNEFSEAMQNRGFERCKRTGKRSLSGVRLQPKSGMDADGR
jgi:putative DNA primase/helicase